MANFGSGRFSSVPVVVKNIIIINAIMVLLQFVLVKFNIDLSDYLALHYWMSPHFRWWQFFTYMFMHGSPFDIGATITHIFFNMYGLFMFGSILENMWGPKRFLTFYIICGLGAGLCHLGVLGIEFSGFHHAFSAFQEHPTLSEFSKIITQNKLGKYPEFTNVLSFWQRTPECSNCAEAGIKLLREYNDIMMDVGVVGASGSLFGVLFAFGYLFPNTELYIMFIPVPIKAKWAVAGYAAIELFSGVGRFQGDNVAHFAHLGGMLFGFIILMIWKRNRNNFY